MTVAYIPNHQAIAKTQSLEQYHGNVDFEGMLDSLTAGVQSLEDALWQLYTLRWLDTATGVQLDGLGQILTFARNTPDDEVYRLELKARSVQLISESEPEALIRVVAFMTGADLVTYQGWYPAGIGLGTDGEVLLGNINLLYDFAQKTAGAGIRVDWLWQFDPVNPFSCDGTLDIGTGLSDLNNPTVGGLLGTLLIPIHPFGTDGDDDSLLGLGTLYGDPILGGNIVSL